jgi:predicted DNA-binding transcriptional regulator AlpA
MPQKARTIEVRLIGAAGDVDRELRRLAGITRATSHRWRSRPDFPKPVKKTKTMCLWDLSEVRAWMARREGTE